MFAFYTGGGRILSTNTHFLHNDIITDLLAVEEYVYRLVVLIFLATSKVKPHYVR